MRFPIDRWRQGREYCYSGKPYRSNVKERRWKDHLESICTFICKL
jgi:hypothetical protein